jgi:tetratricopeptide (TPR) repeat protein
MGSKLLKILTFLIFIVAPLSNTPMQAALRWSPLMEAAFKGDLAELKRLLSAGADVNVKDDDLSTPLMVAASQGHTAIVRELLARGADINMQNKYGWTPLMLATSAKHTEIIKLLLSNGADLKIKKRDGSTAFTIAERVGLANIFSFLAEKKESDRQVELAQKTGKEPHARAEKGGQRAEEEHRRIEEKREREVKRLLALADRQIKALQLTQPVGDNAYESYRQLMELDSGNTKAQAGLMQIVKRYQELALHSKRKGELQESLSYLEKGLKILPENAVLLGLREEVQTQLADVRRKAAELAQSKHKEEVRKATELAKTEKARQQREIGELLAQAERQLNAARLIQPEGDNAYASYRQVLALDPDNVPAQQGLARIAAHYEQLARTQHGDKALQASLATIDEGLEVMPGHEGLLALRKDVEAELAAQEMRQRKIEPLLARAERTFKAEPLTMAAGDDVYESYRQVLTLDPDNSEAKAGLVRLAARYEQLAQKHQRNGALQESLSYVEKGLEMFPQNGALLALRGEIQIKLEEAARRKAAQLAEAKRKKAAARERQRRERARQLANAQQVLREKLEYFFRIEQKLDAEEQAMRLSIQRLLVREWNRDKLKRREN